MRLLRCLQARNHWSFDVELDLFVTHAWSYGGAAVIRDCKLRWHKDEGVWVELPLTGYLGRPLLEWSDRSLHCQILAMLAETVLDQRGRI